jgi:hypothetical protein
MRYVELEGRDIRHDARSGSLIGRVCPGTRHHFKPRPVVAAWPAASVG